MFHSPDATRLTELFVKQGVDPPPSGTTSVVEGPLERLGPVGTAGMLGAATP